MVKPIWLGSLWGFLTGLVVSGIPVFIYVANAYVEASDPRYSGQDPWLSFLVALFLGVIVLTTTVMYTASAGLIGGWLIERWWNRESDEGKIPYSENHRRQVRAWSSIYGVVTSIGLCLAWITGILVLFGQVSANSILDVESLSRFALAFLIPIVVATWTGPHLLNAYKQG